MDETSSVRIYDATLGRFLQADPHIDGATQVGGFNRYAYVKNNPLNAADPSGFFLGKIFKEWKRAWKSMLSNEYIRLAISIGLNFIPGCQVWCMALVQAGFQTASTFVLTGDLGLALKGGIISLASSAAFMGVGGKGFGKMFSTKFGAHLGRSAMHGLIGGIGAELQGGKFGNGFASAGLTKFVNINGMFDKMGMGSANYDNARIVTAAIIGGTISDATGGKFVNGAATAAIGQAFNGNQQNGYEQFQKKYGDILKAGNIDIGQNVKDAASIDTKKWLDKVKTGGDWDYKNNNQLKDAGISSARLDEFGNVHFGIVAKAHGFNLEGSMYGAGAYQVLKQGGGNPADFAAATVLLYKTNGGYSLPDSISRSMTRSGFTWGDNPGDSMNIMNGWDYAEQQY